MQNEKTIQQLIKEHEANIPPEIMNLIKSFDWKKEVRTIVNQNQLMIDVGADLEESIYLVLLGVVTAEDLYKRLIDTHEIPEEKAQKIIQEAESQIFSPMYKKLMELPDEDAPVKKVPVPSTPRDTILAEIEKEPEVLVNLNVASMNQNKPTDTAQSIQNDGIAKPFSIPQTSSAPVGEKKDSIETQIVSAPLSIKAGVVTGIQEDPIASALTQKTQTQAPVQTPKPYVADPYREPIE